MFDKKLTQLEFDELLNEHKKWIDSKNQARSEIWDNANSEERNSTNFDWVYEKLKNYSFEGSQLHLRNTDLSGLNISNTKYFVNLTLENVDLSNCNCENSWLGGEMKNVSFHKARLSKAIFSNAVLKNVDFTEVIAKEAEFDEAKMEDVDFSRANLEKADLMGLFFAKNIKFDNANLNQARFVKSSMDFVSFKNASLVETNFRRAYINHGNFENADCSKANFTFVSSDDWNVKGAIIEEANFEGARSLPEEWKQAIGWYSEEEELKRRIKRHLKENP